MNIKTGKYDTHIIIAIVAIVAVFYLLIYFMMPVEIIDDENRTIVKPPQPIGIDPPSQRVSVGDTVTVNVVSSDAVDLFGYQFDMNYDPAILQYQSVSEGDLLKRGDVSTFCIPHKTDNPGLIKNVVCTRLGQVGGVTGSGILSTITFTSRTAGTSDISLTNVKLADINADELRPQTSSGQVIVG